LVSAEESETYGEQGGQNEEEGEGEQEERCGVKERGRGRRRRTIRGRVGRTKGERKTEKNKKLERGGGE
jgi:hypothetical protein